MSEKADTETRAAAALAEEAGIHRRLLDQMPTALLVVDPSGVISWANRAALRLVGATPEDGIGVSMLEFVHPEDRDWLVSSFLAMVAAKGKERGDGNPWMSLNFQALHRDGSSIPIELTGAGAVDDPMVNGIIYEARLRLEDSMLRRTLVGVGAGDDAATLLGTVTEMVVLPPIAIECAMVDVASNPPEVIASTGPAVAEAVRAIAPDLAPWNGPAVVAETWVVADHDDEVAITLAGLGVADVFHVAVTGVGREPTSVRIVAVTPVHHVVSDGPCQRLQRAAELAAIVVERAHADAAMNHAATHDALTGLLDRAGLRDLIDHGSDLPVNGALYLDLDGFKDVNDRYGHHAGDEVLAVVATRLRHAVRSDDVVSRIGGDEFVVLLRSSPEGRDRDATRPTTVAERVLRSIELPVVLEIAGQTHRAEISASIGVVEVTDGATADLPTLLHLADTAMYSAKRAGGCRWVVANVPTP
jgi:diguanylate cyclase (GGDEF)-like protein/PAS domain S-box-containing protein